MKTILISLAGDTLSHVHQLGIKEKDAFKKLEDRVTKLLSTNSFLRYGQDIVSRARALMKKKETGYFDQVIAAYAEGLGVEPSRYMSFLSLLELAAHYGQIYPELKGLLPGCTSVFKLTEGAVTHSRLLDFPLVGIFDEAPRLYYWQREGKPAILNYSCEGLAPLFFQAIHGNGMSFSLHHKPGHHYHRDGQSIFQITFEALFETNNYQDFRREIKKKSSVTKWGLLLLDKSGEAQALDIDGPNLNFETYNLHETTPLIFTNIPLQKELTGFESFLQFSQDRQNSIKEKLTKKDSRHILDVMTDVEEQKGRRWLHPCATLSTVGAFHVNLTNGKLHIKEGTAALVSSDAIIEFSLDKHGEAIIIKKATEPKSFEKAWKRASIAQSAFDQGDFARAYHELQIARDLTGHPVWKEIFSFYLCLWDFLFITNNRELSMIYKKVKSLRPPENLKDQWLMLCMRMEKKLDLVPTVESEELSYHLRDLYFKEKDASRVVFNGWMKLLYPRMEILDVFSPHHK